MLKQERLSCFSFLPSHNALPELMREGCQRASFPSALAAHPHAERRGKHRGVFSLQEGPTPPPNCGDGCILFGQQGAPEMIAKKMKENIAGIWRLIYGNSIHLYLWFHFFCCWRSRSGLTTRWRPQGPQESRGLFSKWQNSVSCIYNVILFDLVSQNH